MSNKDIEKFLPPEEKNVDNDYKYSRDTYYELVEKGKESLELMIEVARESEHPRAFEVLSGMIKNISDVNDRLMDLNKKKKDLDKKEEKTLDNFHVHKGKGTIRAACKTCSSKARKEYYTKNKEQI